MNMANIIKNSKERTFIQWVILVALVGVLAVSLYFFISNFESLRRGGFIRGHIRRQLVGQKISPDQIRGWMTFRYVNLVFGLPPAYLQNALSIKGSRYPNVSLDALAKQQNIGSAELVAKTINEVKSFHP
jgi:hypothetical protein